MVAYPALSTSTGIEGTVPLDLVPAGQGKSVAVASEISMLEVPEAAELQGDPPMVVSELEGDSSPAGYRWSAYDGAWTGPRIALLVHGINGSSADLLALAIHLRSKGSYDSIYAVDYKLGYHIDSLGAKLASVIGARMPAGTKMDLLAHSMGGLVSRSALENHGAAKVTARFVALGSPHHGVSIAIYLSLIAHGIFDHLVPEINDLSPDSAFLKTLNSGTRVDCTYFGAVGTDPEQLTTYWTVNYFGTALVRLLIGGSFSSVVDGMVGAESAGYDISNKCVTWTTNSFPVNHSYVRGGDQGQQLYEKVFDQVDQWLTR
jgi:triacylglycerol esterase/lipase EstA (alpha/beta hydrolase family)